MFINLILCICDRSVQRIQLTTYRIKSYVCFHNSFLLHGLGEKAISMHQTWLWLHSYSA